MWRSFFFAVGIFLVLAGLQSLVLDRLYINENNRALTLFRRGSDAAKDSISNSIGGPVDPFGRPAERGIASLPSSYYGGPSRFQTSGFNNPVQFDSPSQFNNTSQFNSPAQGNAFQRISTTDRLSTSGFAQTDAGLPKKLKAYVIKDWVPWCLLAAGTIVCLYTRSTGYSRHGGE